MLAFNLRCYLAPRDPHGRDAAGGVRVVGGVRLGRDWACNGKGPSVLFYVSRAPVGSVAVSFLERRREEGRLVSSCDISSVRSLHQVRAYRFLIRAHRPDL